MALADGAAASVDKGLLAKAKEKAGASRGVAGVDIKSHNPVPSVLTSKEVTSRGTAGINVASHNPVPSVMFAPNRDAQLARAQAELAMRAGALTTVPEVESYIERIGYRPTMGPLADEPPPGSSDEDRKGVPMSNAFQSTFEGKEAERKQEDRELFERDRASQRHRAIQEGMRQGGRGHKVEEITREKYDSMTPEQRAAIDLNSMLVEAVRRDRNAVAPKKGVSADYIENLEDAFGEYAYGGEGSKYAPNTVRLLDKIGFSNDSVDLDDVLKLRIAFSAEDVADLKGALSKTSLATPEHMRDTVQSELIAAVQKVRKDPQKGASLLEEQRRLGDYSKVPGFGNDPKSKEFQQWYDIFTRKEFQKDIPEIIKSFKSDHPENPDEVFAEFVNYVNLRSREAMQYRNPLSTDSPELRVRPRKLRRRLGM